MHTLQFLCKYSVCCLLLACASRVDVRSPQPERDGIQSLYAWESDKPIYFGDGNGSEKSSGSVLNEMFQDFLIWVGVYWVNNHTVPTEKEDLVKFDIVSLIPQYKEYIAARGPTETSGRGLSVEESWLVNQLVTHQLFVCLLSRDMPQQTVTRISRKTLLAPDQLIGTLQTIISRDGDPGSFGLQTLIFDGKRGHSIIIKGIEPDTGTFRYWDPWPESTMLADGNNAAGVHAKQTDNPREWTVTRDEMKRVVFAVLVPAALIPPN